MKSERRIGPSLGVRPWWSFAMLVALLVPLLSAPVQPASAAIIGQGFTVTSSDLAYILKQIKIAEYHAANTSSSSGPCGALLGSGPNQIPSPLLSFGLRTVDGSCNNLQAGQESFGAADQTFPRLAPPVFGPAEADPGLFGPPGGPASSYQQTSGFVFDTEPRTVSNLIVDQTSDNPAAVAAAGFPVRSQGNDGVFVCGSPGALPAPNCVEPHQTLFIPNITTDVGLSPPFNGLFTIFGQFFDHGLDKITNGGNGTVVVPLKADDPLVTLGPDGIAGNGDEVPAGLRFMTLTRGKIVVGPDGQRNAPNTDTPFVDQSQTYTSHSSHQFFLREYTSVAGKPVATGNFLDAADGEGIANWREIKAQAAAVLGMALADTDVTNIPMVAVDAYGNYIPGPNGMPQYVTVSGTVEGSLSSPVPPPADVRRIDTAFLNDIAHSADPGSLSAPKTPDADAVAGGSLDPVAQGEYDDELLDIHFICGDGRCNENIALTAIHQVFHSEHNRLVGDIQNTLNANPSLLADYQTINLSQGSPDKTFAYGERLFQAARFVTEMEYQHLVFEEFARKVQPAINPFEPFAFNQTDVNPAITAEFAHAVYRFGHSMLTETIDRVRPDGSHFDIPLLDGFLNPAAYYDGGLNSRQAATAIIMGMSDQTGNEIDEFVTNTLRNNLLGLPLDLAAINMTRARSEGIPSLNNVRKALFAQTNDGQLAPYENWVAFQQALRHPESLVNFVAAYGLHPSIVGAPTLAGKRNAADQIVNGTVLPGPDGIVGADCGTPLASPECADTILPPVDAGDFMFSSGAWANQGGVSVTGLDDVDLWMGGLAENTLVFGGLLGSTFNYVFENQLTNLQNGDRFYYLARTPGMNLRTQLEGNSFSELVMRNTEAYSLKADPFATADCKFHLGELSFPALAGSFITGPGSVNDLASSECNENRLLLQQPVNGNALSSGRIEYRSVNSVDPAGINGQSVYSGTTAIDRIYGGNDNDTFWGGEGNDIIDGRGGDDIVLGGLGNDIITDLGGFDVLKGGPGNDAIDGGVNDDILMGGEGNDFINGGANFNETFGGDGDDFVIAGQGADAVFGDSGNDWQEGGDQPDLLIGDSSTLFFDDHNLPGHDILIGQGGDDDYDMEGGDDIGLAGPGVEKVAGASGWDWEIGLMDPQAQNADLSLLVVNTPPANETRDRYNEIEALSGGPLNDTLRGDDVIPSQTGGGGFIGCDALDANGVARISGLEALVPASIRTVDAAPIVAAAVTNYCQLTGLVWGEGNILIGGAGSDIIEGRGADDIIDGDRYLNVRISLRSDVNNPASEIGSTDLMEHVALSGTFGAGTAGMTLQQAVFAGLVDAGNLVPVREILTPAADAAIDTAVFSGAAAGYSIVKNANGSVTVSDAAGAAVDGTDTLWNIENLQFVDQTISLLNPAPALTTISPTAATAGAAGFTLTVNGSNFIGSSVVRWNGANLVTSFVSSTQLTAAVPATLIATAAVNNVTVFTPTPGGGTSAAAAFTVADAPAPIATSIAPSAVTANSGQFTLTVNGSSFVSTSVVRVGGVARPTTFVSATQLTAVIPAADITTAGPRSITVFTPAPGGGTSAALTLTVNAANQLPTISSLSPSPVTARSGAFILTVNGTNFVSSSQVRFNGATRPTTFISNTQLQAQLAAGDIATAGNKTITVRTTAALTSVAFQLVVNNPGTPVLSAISPATATTGGPGFTLVVTGTGFVSDSQVRVNGINRNTTFVSSTRLTATVPANVIATAGNKPVQVVTPNPGGGTSATTLSIVVTNPPAPVVTSISPSTVTAGAGAFTLTVNGSNFVSTSVVRVNGANRTTTFVSSTQLTAIVTAADIAGVGNRNVTVFTGAPGGGTSAIATLTVNAAPGATAVLQVADLDMGLRRIGVVRTQNLLITNAGTIPLVISSASIAAPFSVDLNTCVAAVAPGRSCRLAVTYAPTAAVASSEALSIFSNAAGSPAIAIITGTGR